MHLLGASLQILVMNAPNMMELSMHSPLFIHSSMFSCMKGSAFIMEVFIYTFFIKIIIL
jgi:hypothetical protein